MSVITSNVGKMKREKYAVVSVCVGMGSLA